MDCCYYSRYGTADCRTETDGSGEMSVDEYDQAARDLTNFLAYVGEPSRLESEALGLKIIGFLVILFILAFMLKKEYWRDVQSSCQRRGSVDRNTGEF